MTTKITEEAARRLRERAEERLKSDGGIASQPLTQMETEHLIHELRLQQIELELQNEELHRIIMSEISDLKLAEEALSQSEGQLRRLNRSIMAISDCNLALFDARDETELLNDICRIAVEIGGYRMAWAGYADQETKSVRPATQAGFEDGYLATIQITRSHKEYEHSPVLTAIRNAQPCLVRDIETDPIFAPWRVEAGKRGYSSMVALPLKTDDQSFGILSIYSASVNAFDAEEIELLTRFADNLSYGIKTMRTRKALLEMEKGAQEAREYAAQLRAVAEKKKGEEWHRTILQTAMDGFWLVDIQGRILDVNDVYCSMSGYSRNELLTMFIWELEANETAADTVAHIKMIMELVEVRFESRHRRKNGTFFDIEASVRYRAFENGLCVCFIRDISERKRSESRVRKLARAVEQSPVSVIITDTGGIIEFVNPKFTRLTGYTAEEAIGQNCRLLKSGLTPRETYQKLWATITGGKTWNGEFANKRKDGSIFYEQATISVIRNDKGEITHYLAAKVDITEKKSIMEQLIHSQKIESIGQLAGGLAHDLNNILTVVHGYASLARERLEKDKTQEDYLDEIVSASLRASSLTRSLLIYSRKQEMNLQKQNLNILITTVGSFIERIIQDNIVFTLALQKEPLGVYVDDGQIEQVLLNLATNARDAMPDGGKFSIETAAGEMDGEYIATHGFGTVGRYAVITVTDSGHGMDAETKRKVFNPFYTTKEPGKGTGLGLSMVMGIIKQHGGFIDLQSEPGRGCVFKLYLPLLAATGAIASATEQDARMERGSGTILLVEDDPPTLILLEELLTRAGYQVITAVDGEDAVKKFVAFDDEIMLVISDLVMPKISGKQARDRIRERDEGMKFIFVSGHTDDVIKNQGELGADVEVIMKPVMPFDLLRKIREIIGSA